mmetsp:Transcript_8447/g.19815  ORF Transcript_8447/g.19815 Transcript_8447/m.19815 type:complete len:208 (+) Transcript_8447:991-1614(+)
MICPRHSTRDARVEFGVVKPLPCVKLRAAAGELNHDRGVGLARSLKASIDAGGGDTIHRWDCEPVLLGPLKQVSQTLTRNHTWVDALRQLGEGANRGPLAQHREALLFDTHRLRTLCHIAPPESVSNPTSCRAHHESGTHSHTRGSGARTTAKEGLRIYELRAWHLQRLGPRQGVARFLEHECCRLGANQRGSGHCAGGAMRRGLDT